MLPADPLLLALASATAGTIATALVAAWYIRSLRAGERRLLALIDQRTADLVEREKQLEVANELLQHLATIDDLTSIANARRFKVVLAHEWQCARRAGLPISLLMIDVDLFKRFNDALGHQRGDECLVRVAGVLRQTASRANDLAARYGGEEFALLLPHTHADGARALAEAVRSGVEALQIPHPDSGISRYVTVSVGIATAVPTTDGNVTDDLVGAADRALYEAKKAGRNCTLGPLATAT